MQKKHQISILTAQPTPKQKQWGYKPFPLTKNFKNGHETETNSNTWFNQKIIEWDNLEELYKTLEPYIKGRHPEAYFSALLYGQFLPGTDEPYGTRRQNANIEDTPHNYLILSVGLSKSLVILSSCHLIM